MKQTGILTHATHVNGWFPAVYMSCISQNFRLLHVSNLSVRNFRFFFCSCVTGSLTAEAVVPDGGAVLRRAPRRRSVGRPDLTEVLERAVAEAVVVLPAPAKVPHRDVCEASSEDHGRVSEPGPLCVRKGRD